MAKKRNKKRKNVVSDNEVIVVKEFQKTRRAQIRYDLFVAGGIFLLISAFFYTIIRLAEGGVEDSAQTVLRMFMNKAGYLISYAASVLFGIGYKLEHRRKKRALRKLSEFRKKYEANDPDNSSSGLDRYNN